MTLIGTHSCGITAVICPANPGVKLTVYEGDGLVARLRLAAPTYHLGPKAAQSKVSRLYGAGWSWEVR